MFSYKRGAIPVGSLKGDCAPSHGAGGAGAKGYPNLVDNKWLWGGKLDDIAQTITHGARAGDAAGRQGSMPAFGREGLLKPDEISTVADYVRSLSGLKTELGADLARDGKIFADNCAVCHGPRSFPAFSQPEICPGVHPSARRSTTKVRRARSRSISASRRLRN
jgi:cytochrome c oxidase cbb3-type subunit 3